MQMTPDKNLDIFYLDRFKPRKISSTSIYMLHNKLRAKNDDFIEISALNGKGGTFKLFTNYYKRSL